MTDPNDIRLEQALRASAHEARSRPAPPELRDAVLKRCAPRVVELSRRRQPWPSLAAAALVLIAAGWSLRATHQERAADFAAAPVKLLHQVTSEPVDTAMRLGDVAFVQQLGEDVQAGLARAGARTTQAARVLATRLAGPLSMFAQVR